MRFNGADIIFLFRDGLSFIINSLSFNSRKNILFSRFRMLNDQIEKKKKNADPTFSYFQWKTYVCLKLKIFKFQSNI